MIFASGVIGQLEDEDVTFAPAKALETDQRWPPADATPPGAR